MMRGIPRGFGRRGSAMRGIRLLGTMAAAVAGLFAQGTKDPAALSLLNQAAQQHGAPPGRVRTLEASGVFRSGSGDEIPFRVLADGVERFRWEFGEGREAQVVLIRGLVGFRYEAGERRAVTAREAAGLRGELLPVLALGEWISSPSERLEQAEDGASVDISRISSDAASQQTIADATRVRVVFDEADRLAKRVELRSSSRSGKYGLPMRILFSDYAETDGTQWPTAVRVVIEGGPAGTYFFKQVRLNVPVTDADFQEVSK